MSPLGLVSTTWSEGESLTLFGFIEARYYFSQRFAISSLNMNMIEHQIELQGWLPHILCKDRNILDSIACEIIQGLNPISEGAT